MAKAKILTVEGSVKGEIELPKCFETGVREDIVRKAFLTLSKRQPYGSFPLAGQLYSASGIFHQTQGRKYKTKKGLGISRIPRKIMSRKGVRVSRVGATIPGTRGGREAHPPKASKIWTGSINKKEMKMAINSLISATTSKDLLQKYYPKADFSKINLPLVVEENLVNLDKTKKLKESVSKILGNASYLAERNKVLIISDKAPKFSHSAFEFAKAEELNVTTLAPSGKPGRLTIYTEGAIEKLRKRESK